jgi:DNA-binding NarL/FixJ family response regulator
MSYKRFRFPPDVFPSGFVILYNLCGKFLRRRNKMRVFITDDSKVVVERLHDLLKDVSGLEVVGQAGNVPDAVSSIKKTNPDAVILDLQMPGGSGLDVLRAIRPGHPRLQVLVCTNYPHPQYRDQCMAAGANYFLDKSADFDKIPAIFRRLIKGASKRPHAAN